jgi:hypothetical protein
MLSLIGNYKIYGDVLFGEGSAELVASYPETTAVVGRQLPPEHQYFHYPLFKL